MSFRPRDLRRLVLEDGVESTKQLIRDEKIALSDFSLRELTEELIEGGREFVRLDKPTRRVRGIFEAAPANRLGAGARTARQVFEASTDAVGADSFTEISGQLLWTDILKAIELENLIGDKLCSIFPSKIVKEEKIPGVTADADFSEEVPARQPFPLLGMTDAVVEIPRAKVHGAIIGLGWEVVQGNETAMIIEEASRIDVRLAVQREKMILRTALGLVENDYCRNNVRRNTYGIATENHYFLNEDDAALADYSDLIEAEMPLRNMRDPATGEPMLVSPKVMVQAPTAQWVGRRLLNSTELRTGNVTAAPGYQTREGNPIPYQLELVGNEYVPVLIQECATIGGYTAGDGPGGIKTGATVYGVAAAYWYLGDFKKAIVWKELHALDLETAPVNNEAQWRRNIWLQWKTWFSGTAGAREPRHVVRIDGTG